MSWSGSRLDRDVPADLLCTHLKQKHHPTRSGGGGAILFKKDVDKIQKTGWSRFVQEIYQWSQLTSNGYESVILQMSEFLNTTTQDKYLFQTDSADGKIVMTI